jgi:hypothetical protein
MLKGSTREIAALLICTAMAVASSKGIAGARSQFADTDECNSAIDQYNLVLGDVSDYLKKYADCIDSSRGTDDCSLEFEHLKSSQDDFEEAVSQYGADCP